MAQFALNYLSLVYSLLPIVVIGSWGYRRLNVFYKLFLLQAIIAMILYAIVAADFHANNQNLFNIYIVLESAILIGAPATLMTSSRERWLILIGFLLFACAYSVNLTINGTRHLAIHALAIESIPVLIIYLTLIYRAFENKADRSIIWLCIGIAIYCCGIAPAMGFITPKFSTLGKLFQSRIIEPLGHLRYVLTAISFWLYLRRNHHQSTPINHG